MATREPDPMRVLPPVSLVLSEDTDLGYLRSVLLSAGKKNGVDLKIIYFFAIGKPKEI